MNLRDRLNIVIPLYNPHDGWEDHFIDSVEALKVMFTDLDLRIILVNDGSTNQLGKIETITNRFDCLQYHSYPVNRGKGHAIRYGINSSEADFYVYTDIDFPFGCQIISETYRILKYTKKNIVIGTRDLSYFKMLPLNRRIYSLLLKELNFFITGFKIRDTQAGLKGLDNKARKVLASTKIDTFLFELEFLKNSVRQGLTYEFVNVSCRPRIRFTNFRFRILMRETHCLLKLLFS
jgi:glycosyltransferase involved in cell wall biosynthesis